MTADTAKYKAVYEAMQKIYAREKARREVKGKAK